MPHKSVKEKKKFLKYMVYLQKKKIVYVPYVGTKDLKVSTFYTNNVLNHISF